MKRKSFFLLLIFLLSLIPFESVHASNELSRTLENSVSLMYVSDAILLNEIVDDEISSTSKVSTVTKPDVSSDEKTDLINQMINATKAQRNDHDRKCRETVEIYRQQGKTCEVDQTNAYCKSKRAELTAKIAALRKARGGDKRKWFTKQWHGLKRAGAKFWHRIGPLGRKFLQEVGPRALKIVLAGSPGTEALLKNLIKHTAKNMARQRFKQIGFQALQRILKVQIEVASAAGVDICDPEEDQASSEQEEDTGKEPPTSNNDFPPDGAHWKCEDVKGRLWNYKVQEGPATKNLIGELDFWIKYLESGQAMHIYFALDVEQEWAVTQVDGSLGDWHIVSINTQAEDTSVSFNEFGIFEGSLILERTHTEHGNTWPQTSTMNYYGLVSPENYEKAYICDVGANPLPTGLETLSPDNFQDRCGTFYYYVCNLILP
ncbi:MAG: hypothetical protein V3R33_09625 [Anaerolineales bacterium]